MVVTPLRNEKRPLKPLKPWLQPPETYKYKVQTGDTWITLGARNNHEFGEHHLIWINFQLSPVDPYYTEQVNWYLREYVGCRHSHDGGKNWAFTSDASPGYIFLPHRTFNMDAIAITGKRGVGGISAPQYNDDNAYDTVSKALDIYGIAEMGIGVSEVVLPLLVEAGMIVTGTLAAIVGPAIAVGAGHNDALKKTSRDFFFNGFCPTLVMAADGWSVGKVQSFFPPLQELPANSVYPEKRETFRTLYNFGLKAGLMQARHLNTVDVRNMFVLLRSRLSVAETEEYNGAVKDWPDQKKKNYYNRLGSILKNIMTEKNLQVKFRD